jgi:hypothetical protein
MKHHCPQDWVTCFDEAIEEFSPHSPPHKMATRAPPAYIIPNDVEGQD